MSRDEERDTIFLVFYVSQYEPDTFCAAFYTHEKAQAYANKMNDRFSYGAYIVKEEEIQ